MRILLNTLYVTTPEAYLSKDGLNVVVSVKQQEVFRIPIHNLEQIVTFGYMGASPGLMKLCADNNVGLTFLSPNGRYISRSQGPTRGNVLLRKAQYVNSDNVNYALHLSKLFIAAKLQNYRNILRRFVRDNGENQYVENAAEQLQRCKTRVLNANSIDSVRGIEGEAATDYFAVFQNLILHQKEDFVFKGRNRRPPKDAVNAMLSFVYTLIANDMIAALETVGLDPYVGFLHQLRPGRASLALDMMEEFRAYLGDRLVLSLVNRKQITIKEFIQQGEESIVMTDNGRKAILSAWQSRKKEIIVHPYLNEKVSVGLLPYIQAMMMARFIRKDIDDYPVFLIK
jgi:CRISP-associated protein Cas1